MKQFIYIIGFFIVVTSCQKVIDVDLNDADPKFVIEAYYTAEDSTVRAKVTFTSNYFDASAPAAVNNATVEITDHLGATQIVPSIGDGMYELTNYIPIFETSYTMSVTHGGVTYTSVSTLHQPVLLEDITYEYYPGFFGLDPGYVCDLNFNDPPGVENYFVIAMSLNGEEDTKLTSLFLHNDTYSDGNIIKRPLFTDEFYQLGDTVGMELRSVDAVTYQYIYEAWLALSQSSAAPSNPTSNWTNDALGYFSAYSNSRKEVVIVE